MKKVILVILALAIVTGLVWYYATRQAPAPKGASLLPETTLLYVSLPDFPKSREKFKHTQAYALWQEPEVQAFLEKPLRELFGAGHQKSSVNLLLHERIIGAMQGEVFLGVTRISPPPLVQAGIVLGADVKHKRLEAQAYLKWLERNLAENYPGATATDKSYLGKTYTVWQLTQNQQTCHAFLNSLLIFTLDENLMRDILTRFAGQASDDSKSLAANARFQATLKRIPAGHEGVAYFNVEQMFGLFAPLLALSPQTGGIFQKLAGIGATAASVTFQDGPIEDLGLVAYSGNHKPAPATERRTLALTAPDTTLYSVRTADLAGSYRNTMNLIAQSGHATLTASAAQFDRELTERGLHLDEILGSLGPEIATLGVWREGARFPELALVAEVQNAGQARAKIDSAFEAVNEAGAGPSEAQPYLGEVLHTWHAGDVLSPSYVVTDKFLILASTADYARALMSQSKKPAATLAGNADFAKATQHLAAQTTSFTYCDVPRVFAALTALAKANAGNSQFIDLGALPKPATLAKHLSPYVSATVDTSDWETTTTVSPLGKPLTFLVAIAGAAGAAQPWLAEFIPALPIPSSGTPPAGNRTAPSRTPAKR